MLGCPRSNRPEASRPRAGEVSPGRSADLVRTPQLLPGTPLGGDPCEYFSGGLAVQPRVGARALNRANFSREQFVGRGGETGKGGRGTSYVYGGWERAVAEVELKFCIAVSPDSSLPAEEAWPD